MTHGGKTHAPTSQGDPQALWNRGRHICPGENLYPMLGARVGKGSREAPGKTPRLRALAPGVPGLAGTLGGAFTSSTQQQPGPVVSDSPDSWGERPRLHKLLKGGAGGHI